MQDSDVLIVGAGISGLLCATELQKTGRSVRVLDKGRGLGGRMATRRMADARLDHGAQFFTVRDARFQAYVDHWLAAGLIKEWFCRSPKDEDAQGYPRYCGRSGMTDVPKYLARSLNVHTQQNVVKLTRDQEVWSAFTLSGQCFQGKELVVTVPLPQAMSLLDTTGLRYANGQEASLRGVRYQRGLATLVILDGPSALPVPGGIQVNEGPLSWIGDNQQKGISPAVSAVTLHADADFAEAHWDSPNELRGRLMIEAAMPYLKANVLEYDCHRWGFTLPVNPWPEGFYRNPGLNLTLAGDAFGGPRIEGAALSGLDAAAALARDAPA